MKNFILKFKIFYRSYQKLIRKNKDDYKFIEYIFSQNGKAYVLDLCCGDSYVLDYIKENVLDYIGIDNNINYLESSRLKYPKFKFINSNLEDIDKILILENKKIDFIFLNGAIHHLNNNVVLNLLKYLEQKYPNAKFLTIDPVIDKNKFLNRLMIKFDRGNFIRDINNYEKIMKKFDYLITDDFFRMSFKLIFHYKNFDLRQIYKNWKI